MAPRSTSTCSSRCSTRYPSCRPSARWWDLPARGGAASRGGLKFSVVDVKVRDARGTVFVVEMQVLQVEGFQKRVVYNASKALVAQLARGDASTPSPTTSSPSPSATSSSGPGWRASPRCRWSRTGACRSNTEGAAVWRRSSTCSSSCRSSRSTGRPGPRSRSGRTSSGARRSSPEVPTFLHSAGPRAALDAARTAHFSSEEWEAYDRVKVAGAGCTRRCPSRRGRGPRAGPRARPRAGPRARPRRARGAGADHRATAGAGAHRGRAGCAALPAVGARRRRAQRARWRARPRISVAGSPAAAGRLPPSLLRFLPGSDPVGCASRSAR
ncbi:MAG: PD-(D/E)XK nuclease family transposase [Deltaproteobacteria bacterium]|nr:PD-(D/E)XK nuclease family transposase [Deltaproteobacteria bacterium]